MRPIYIFGLAFVVIAGISLYERRTMGWASTSSTAQNDHEQALKKRYGVKVMSNAEDDEYNKLFPAAMKGDKNAKARINQLHNLETARSLKEIKKSTGSYPTPAKIPPELKQYYQHTMPDKIPEIIDKAHAGHPLTDKEETQLHSIEARGKVSSCGAGCICQSDGHCSLGCPAAVFECDYSKDKHSYAHQKPSPSPHIVEPVQKPGIFDSIAKGVGDAWNHLVHGQNLYGQPMGGGVIGTPQPVPGAVPIPQTPIPIAGYVFGYGYRYAGFYDLPA